MRHIRPATAILALVFLAGIAQAQSYGRYQTLSGPATVTDGDTVEIAGDAIRLWGIDTPESAQRCSDEDGACFACGEEAENQLKALINNAGADVVYCTATGDMSYGRYIGICYAGDTNLNEKMVLSGWGVSYDRYTPAMVPAERRARALKRGIWAGEFVLPEAWRRGDRLDCEAEDARE